MGKTALTVIFWISLSGILLGQSVEHNLEKYWYYRYRLEKDFMILNSPDAQGTNIPANIRHYMIPEGVSFGGENPFYYNIGPYISVLATEYRLLKNYGMEQLAAETLQKLYWAIYAVDRIDLNTEKFFIADGLGINRKAPNYWEQTAALVRSEHLNGLIMRSDVDGLMVENGNDLYDIGDIWTFRAYSENLSANILGYNDNQLQEGSCLTMPGENEEEPQVTFTMGRFNQNKVIDSQNKTLLSYDEAVALLLGLSFVNKYVDDDRIYLNILGKPRTVKQMARDQAFRLFSVLYAEGAWYMQNPYDHNDTFIVPGGLWASAYGFSKLAENQFGYTDFPAGYLLLPGQFGTVQLASYTYGWKIAKRHGFWNNIMLLSAMSNTAEFKKSQKVFQKATNHFGTPAYEFLPLIHSLLYDMDMSAEWDYSLLSGGDTYSRQDYKDFLNFLLNKATDCGPWKFCRNSRAAVVSDNYWYDSRYNPNRVKYIKTLEEDGYFAYGDEGDYDESAHQYGCWSRGYRNGLEYMFLHNLYWLEFEKYIPHTVPEWDNFPTIVWVDNGDNMYAYETGSHASPYDLVADDITASNEIMPEADVSYIAGKSITLKAGFKTHDGCRFQAKIDGNKAPVYIYKDFKPECYFTDDYNAQNVNNKWIASEQTTDYDKSENTVEEGEFDVSDPDSELGVYPNPFTNEIVLNYLPYDDGQSISVRITNLYGSTVFEGQIKNNERIPLAYLSSGIYLLKAVVNNQTITDKIIKR